ncbi:MAG: hypothetical protein Q7J54_07745 [Candidatus Woesearchaeota archaeon]|nr:hypothetical protein [Candidatus Woesearchaeota archaeon]
MANKLFMAFIAAGILVLAVLASLLAVQFTNEKTNKNNEITSTMAFNDGHQPKASPSDWIKEDQIHVLNNNVVIDLKDAQWATFTDTHSMEPVLSKGSNAIEIVPKDESYINVGDIVSYKSEYADGSIIHRVIAVGQDSDGWYAMMKGDNNPEPDPGRIRFSQIQRLVVAIIY